MPGRDIDTRPTFDASEIRTAERDLAAALESAEATAWVYHYTEDAVFDAGGDHVVQGRDALLAMALAMKPLSSVSIEPLRTEGRGDLATVWTKASWISEGDDPVNVRGMILWRRDPGTPWRVAIEHIG